MWNHYGAGVLSTWERQGYHHYSGPDQLRGISQSLARGPDLVFASRFFSTRALLQAAARPTRLFVDLSDLEHQFRLRSAMAKQVRPATLLYLSHIPAIMLAERRIARMADTAFVCSEREQRYVQRLGFGRHIEVVPNAMPIPAQPAPPISEPTVLFIGTYGYPPNCDAADRLIRQIWPKVLQQVPEARLTIAGKGPERIASFNSAGPAITFTGFVDDLDQLYAESRVVVCPIMVGGGTRLKLVEAASYGRPMISTRIGAEGLHFEADREILLRDDDASFAQACVELLRDDVACARLGAAARDKMQDQYGSAQAIARIADIMRRSVPRT